MRTVISIGNQPQKHQCNLQKHLRDQDPWNQGKHSLRRLPFKTSTENPNDLPMTFKVVQGHKSWRKYVKLGGGYKSLKDLTSPFTCICCGRKDISYLHISPPPPQRSRSVRWYECLKLEINTIRIDMCVFVCVHACVCTTTQHLIFIIFIVHTKKITMSVFLPWMDVQARGWPNTDDYIDISF